MSINSTIRQRRLDLGLSEQDVAQSLDMSVSSYCDLEAYQDEWLDVSLGQLRKLSQVLRFDIFTSIDSQPAPSTPPERRAGLLTDALRAAGTSASEISDQINVQESNVEEALTQDHALEGWPMSFVIALCEKLRLPLLAVVLAPFE